MTWLYVGRERNVGRWGGECVGEGCVCGVCGWGEGVCVCVCDEDVYMHELQVKYVTI